MVIMGVNGGLAGTDLRIILDLDETEYVLSQEGKTLFWQVIFMSG